MDSPQILVVLDEEQEDLFRAASEVRYLGAGHFCGGGRGGGHREVSPSSLSVSTSSFFRLRFPIHRTNIPHRTHVCLSPPLILGTEGGILRRDSRLGEEVDARMTSRDFPGFLHHFFEALLERNINFHDIWPWSPSGPHIRIQGICQEPFFAPFLAP